MAGSEKDDIPMLSATYPQMFNEQKDSKYRSFGYQARSASMSTTSFSTDSYSYEIGNSNPDGRISRLQMSGPLYLNRSSDRRVQPSQNDTVLNVTGAADKFKFKDPQEVTYVTNNEHLYKSGQLGLCSDPYCTSCPTSYKAQGTHRKNSADQKFHSSLYGDAKGCATRLFSVMNRRIFIPGVMNPHAKVIQQWNKFFVISSLVAIFVDPLFFFLLSVHQRNKCIVINWPVTTAIVVLRSITDFIHLLHILLQFRLAYVSPESRVVGAGDLVDQPKKIALNYLSGYFTIDLFVVLPLPQIIILLILPTHLGSSGATYAKNLLRVAVLVQYVPRLYRFMPLLAGQTPSGFIFESAWANFVINLLTFVLAGHVVGSCWYLFGLQGVNQCLGDACRASGISECKKFIDCGHGNVNPDAPGRREWAQSEEASYCFQRDGFEYGIYIQAVNLTTQHSFIKRYVYSLFWGFQTNGGTDTEDFLEGRNTQQPQRLPARKKTTSSLNVGRMP